MANAYAQSGYGAISKETTAGVAITTPDFFYPFQEITFDHPNELIEFTEIRGSRQAKQAQDGAIRPTATVRGAVYPSGGFALILLGVLGQVTSAVDAPSSTAHKHTFADAPNLPSFTLERSNAHQGEGTPFCERIAGCKVESFGLDLSFGEQVAFNASFQAMKRPVAGTAVTRAAAQAGYPSELPLYFGGASVKVDGVANSYFKSLSIEFQNGLERQETLNGTQEANDICEGAFDVTLSGSMQFANTDMYDLFKNGTEIEVEVHCDNKQFIDQPNSKKWGLDLVFPRVRVQNVSLPFAAGEVISADVEFSVLYDQVTQKSVTPILLNDEDGTEY